MFPQNYYPHVIRGVPAAVAIAMWLAPMVRAENPPQAAPAAEPAAAPPKADAPPLPAAAPGRKAPPKLGDEQVEIESQFFEVSEETARTLGLISTLKDAEPSGVAVPGKAAQVVPAKPKLNAIMNPADAKEFLDKVRNTKGSDLICAPRMTTRSGMRAVIENIREFRYPTEFSVDKDGGNPIPSAFETRNLGVTLEVEPQSSGGAIDLDITPQVVEFEGYMNATEQQPVPLLHGGAIGANMGLKDFAAVKAPKGAILQPVFSTRKFHVNVALSSGQSVLVGGVKREEVSDKRTSRMLYVFVTARSADRPVRFDEKFADVLPVAVINPADNPGFVRSPYAPDARAVDARDLPAGTELKCPVTKKLFRLP